MQHLKFRSNTSFTVLSLILLSIIFSSTAKAQESDVVSSTPSLWVEAGPSITTLGLGYSGGLNAQIRGHYFAVKSNSTDLSYWDETWDVSFIYGRFAERNNFKFYAGTGVSVLGGTSYSSLFETDKSEEINPVIGFPLIASAYWHPVQFVDIGLHAFANVNTEQPFGGLGITLRAGYFNY